LKRKATKWRRPSGERESPLPQRLGGVSIVVEQGREIQLDADAAVDLGRALRRVDAEETPGDSASASSRIQEALAGGIPQALRWTETEEASVLAVLNARQELAGQHLPLRELRNELLRRN
jgi:hypothetical protein